VGIVQGEASCVRGLAVVAHLGREFARATELYRQALVVFRRIQWKWGIASCLSGLGELARDEGKLAVARDLFQEAIPLYRELKDAHRVSLYEQELEKID
jgi:hypothetical protein